MNATIILITLVIMLPVGAYLIHLAGEINRPTAADMQYVSSRPVTIPNHWKKVVYIQYKDNILMLKHKDYSFIEYTHHSNEPYQWKKRLNKKKFITDQQTINQLDEYYLMALNGKRQGGGWVKTLR